MTGTLPPCAEGLIENGTVVFTCIPLDPEKMEEWVMRIARTYECNVDWAWTNEHHASVITNDHAYMIRRFILDIASTLAAEEKRIVL